MTLIRRHSSLQEPVVQAYGGRHLRAGGFIPGREEHKVPGSPALAVAGLFQRQPPALRNLGGDTFQDLSPFSGDRAILFSLDPITLQQKNLRDLGKDRIAKTYFAPGIRFTLTPDGKSLTWVTGTFRTDLWLLQGYRQPGWLGRF